MGLKSTYLFIKSSGIQTQKYILKAARNMKCTSTPILEEYQRQKASFRRSYSIFVWFYEMKTVLFMAVYVQREMHVILMADMTDSSSLNAFLWPGKANTCKCFDRV